MLELAKVILSRCAKDLTLSHGSSIIKNMLVHFDAIMAHLLFAFVMCFRGVIDALAATSSTKCTYKYIRMCSILEAYNGLQ